MNTSNLLRRLVTLLSVSLFLGLLVNARAADDRGELFGTVPVPAGLAKEEVTKIMATTLVVRNWELKTKEEGLVVGYLKHRSNEATVTLVYQDAAISIYCVGYDINKKTGERRKPEQPTGWLKFIKNDLIKNLNLANLSK